MVQFLQPIQVKALLLDPQRRDNILILDVRDDDFAGGHDFAGVTISPVQRGPTAARRIHERLLQLEREGKPEICVMAHGWRRWQNLFGDDPQLCVYPT
ncbi:hypothetical protein Ndes2526B_g08091 [Nannochloris sp. 'desiccata']